MTGPHRPATVLVVCGLAVEARIAAGPGVRIVMGGGRPASLAAAIEREADGVSGIVSFGLAGGLAPDLDAGALLIGSRIAALEGDYPVDAEWTARWRRCMPHASFGAIFGRDTMVGRADAKKALRDTSSADAVDMESHIAARIAETHHLPFAALRAISDPAGSSLPPAAAVAMRDSGGVDLVAVFGSIVRRPGQLPSLVGLALDTRKALRALGHGRRLAGDGFGNGLGHPDLDQLPVDVV